MLTLLVLTGFQPADAALLAALRYSGLCLILRWWA